MSVSPSSNSPSQPLPSRMQRQAFLETFSNCFRNGTTLAGRAFDKGLDCDADTSRGLFEILRAEFRAASETEKFEVLKGYTPLDPRIEAAKVVADESQAASLDAMTEYQKGRLLELLGAYVEKFGFDAIFVVRSYTTAQLLAALEARIHNDRQTELAVTYGEVELLAEIQVVARFAA
ncbi:2-oxo-4-hydroxy-4-carboxy-5-ureidoimidazoline decarboxylase [Mesorhizobium sp. CC13]|uniref:2-oxo-4-hydroxy-4-carboxy-5-ureidoimidazoline decarboxylase n=1 Tax=Mesorhizobium sp. CC13 TaxID=3029194 RepID=UPI0032637BB2